MRLVFATLCIAVSCQAGVLLDKNGKVSPDGKSAFHWLNEVLTTLNSDASKPGKPAYRNADTEDFEKQNRQLIAWELEKLLKRQTFGVNIPFPRTGRSSDYMRMIQNMYKYLRYTPEAAAQLEKVLYLTAMQRSMMSHGRYQPHMELDALSNLPDKNGTYYKRLSDMIKGGRSTSMGRTTQRSQPSPIRFPPNMPEHIRKRYEERLQARRRVMAKRSGKPQATGQPLKQYSTLTQLLSAWLNARTYTKESYYASANKLVDQEKAKSLDVIYQFVMRPKSERIWEWAFIQFGNFGEKSIPYLKKMLENSKDDKLRQNVWSFLEKTCKKTGQKPLSPVYGQLLQELKENRYWPYDRSPFRTTLAVVPSDLIVNYIIDNKLPLTGNEFFFAKALANVKTFRKPVIAAMSETVKNCNDFQKEQAILEIAVKNKLPASSFEPILLEILTRRTSTKQVYITYYYQFSKNLERCMDLLVKNQCLTGLGRFYLAFARETNDFNRTVSLQDELMKKIPRKPMHNHHKSDTLSKKLPPLLQYRKDTFRGELLPLLQYKSNLSDDNQMAILESYVKSPYPIRDPAFTINPVYYSAISKLCKKTEYATGNTKLFLILCQYTDSEKWPDEMVNFFLNSYKTYWIEKHGQLSDSDCKAIYGVTSLNARKKLVETCIKIVSSPAETNLQGFAEQELLRNADISLEALTKLVNSDDSYMATKACNLIGKMDFLGQPAIPALEKATKSNDWTIQVCAINALGQIGAKKESTRKRLIEALDNKNKGVRQAAAEALVLLGDSYSKDVVDKIIATEYYKNTPMGKMNERWIEELLQELASQ